nr:BppU family phage baseplate upper protein [Bacillus sp. TH13]
MKFDLTYPSEQTKIVQRLGEKTSTDILVQVFNKGVPYNLAGMTLGFELRTDNNKIIIDKEQSRFMVIEPLKGVFSYRMHPNAQSFEGNAYIAYFTFEQGGARITTERFRVLNDEDVQNVCAPDIQQHYVSVIDDLVASNKSAMVEAQAIRDMVNANQVVRKTGDTVTGPINFDSPFTVRGVGATFDMRPQVSGAYQKGFRHTVNTTNNFYAVAPIDDTGSATWANQFSLNGTTGVFDVKDLNVRVGSASNVVTKLKDGRASLTLTSDATNTDAGYPPIVTRRGNSATLRMAISRNAGSASSLVTTLPVDMRPIDNLTHAVIADDSTVIKMVIQANGEVRVFTAGKLFNFVATYVVD